MQIITTLQVYGVHARFANLGTKKKKKKREARLLAPAPLSRLEKVLAQVHTYIHTYLRISTRDSRHVPTEYVCWDETYIHTRVRAAAAGHERVWPGHVAFDDLSTC